MKFKKVQFVYINVDYLKTLHRVEAEIFYDETNGNYKIKPHLGILLTNDNIEYVIPLTSAKEKHRTWSDVSSDWYRIFELIDITNSNTVIRRNDIIVDVKNKELLKDIEVDKKTNYRQRILAVLDMRKMFPVKEGLYTKVNFEINSSMPKSETQRNNLMIKEYLFLEGIKDKIEEKASKIYLKQISKGKVLKYHCDYKKLEDVLDNYDLNRTDNTKVHIK